MLTFYTHSFECAIGKPTHVQRIFLEQVVYFLSQNAHILYFLLSKQFLYFLILSPCRKIQNVSIWCIFSCIFFQIIVHQKLDVKFVCRPQVKWQFLKPASRTTPQVK